MDYFLGFVYSIVDASDYIGLPHILNYRRSTRTNFSGHSVADALVDVDVT